MCDILSACLLIGFIGAVTGIFYNYLLQPQSLLSKLGAYLNDWATYENDFKEKAANILGACIYCNTTWITLVILFLFWTSYAILPKWEIILIGTLGAIGTQHICIRLWFYLTDLKK